jgi:hypothetical protein
MRITKGKARTKSKIAKTDKELGIKNGGAIKPRIVKKRDGNRDVKIY